MRRRLPAAILAALAMVLLGGGGTSVLAQPVASIALPDPGGVEQLYAGCNNISLTFPDTTLSQTVIQAVTPAGTAATLWYFNGPLNTFEGFSPAYPQVSDLMSVSFLDAVSLCVAPAPSNTVWLCRPGLADNPCEAGLTTTVVSADGSSTVEEATPATDPPIDCFYVYPTVSDQKTPNATLDVDPEERAIAFQQASRFSQACKVYAPMYRQRTLTALLNQVDSPEIRAIAYGDVLSAWQDYMAHYNNGRGFVLIGHSQGTRMLTQLAASEIDPNPTVRSRLVSALLIGGNVTVAAGQHVGGSFQNIPACQSSDQTGCVVAYSSFDEPPPPDSRFGRTSDAALAVLCVNPASPVGGEGPLQPYFGTAPFPGTIGTQLMKAPQLPTPWVANPGLYTARCESSGGADWLQVDTTNIPGDQRPAVRQTLGPTWGLHLYDVNLALGNLVDLVRQQTAAFSR